jgi:hypothetical protein
MSSPAPLIEALAHTRLLSVPAVLLTTSETLALTELYVVVSDGVNVTLRVSVPTAGTVPAGGE